MKITRRILALLLPALLLFGLLGCQSGPASAPAPAASGDTTGEPDPQSREPDPTPVPDPTPLPDAEPLETPVGELATNRHYRSPAGTTVADNGDVLFFVIGPYLGFYDRQTGISGPLCGRPECTHQDWSCDAYVNLQAKLIAADREKVYWLGFGQQYRHVNGAPAEYGIWQANLDGTNRKQIKEFPVEFMTNPVYRILLHRGKLYVQTTELLVLEAVPESHFRIYETQLTGGGEFRLILDYVGNASFDLVQNYLYVLTFADPGSATVPMHGPEITRYDLDTGRTEQLLSAEAAPDLSCSFYVRDDLTVILSDTSWLPDTPKLYRISDGRLEPLPGSIDDAHVFSAFSLTEGIASTIHYSPEGEEIWLCNLDGNTLYKGAWKMPYLDRKNGASAGPVFKEFLGGENDHVLYWLAETMGGWAYIVQVSTTVDGLEENVLWEWNSEMK